MSAQGAHPGDTAQRFALNSLKTPANRGPQENPPSVHWLTFAGRGRSYTDCHDRFMEAAMSSPHRPPERPVTAGDILVGSAWLVLYGLLILAALSERATELIAALQVHMAPGVY